MKRLLWITVLPAVLAALLYGPAMAEEQLICRMRCEATCVCNTYHSGRAHAESYYIYITGILKYKWNPPSQYGKTLESWCDYEPVRHDIMNKPPEATYEGQVCKQKCVTWANNAKKPFKNSKVEFIRGCTQQ